MSRFINLEFGDLSEGRFEPEETVKDGSYYLSQAQQHFEHGRFEPALRAYARVLEHNPQNPAAWAGQVRMLIELGEAHEASLWCDKALERFPQEADLLAAKAVALARIGHLDDALGFSDASFESAGDSAYLWLARAEVLLARKERRAAFCFERLGQVANRTWVSQWMASRLRLAYRQPALALPHARCAMELGPTVFLVWLQLGLCQQALGMMTPAGTSFTRALELNPDCLEAQRGLKLTQQTDAWTQLRLWLRRLLSS